VQHDVRRALGRLGQLVFAHVPARDAARRGGPEPQPQARGLLAVGVAQHHRAALAREVTGDVGGERRLADAALRIGNDHYGHDGTPPVRYVTGMDEQAKNADTRVLVLAAHPNWRESRVNRRLVQAARDVAGVQVRDLYSLYPDFDVDAAAEQE